MGNTLGFTYTQQTTEAKRTKHDFAVHLSKKGFCPEHPDIQLRVKECFRWNTLLPSCPKCNEKYLPDDSRFAVIHLHEQATKMSSDIVKVTRHKTNQNFGFGTVPFIYDSDDYKYIPGLKSKNDLSGCKTELP